MPVQNKLIVSVDLKCFLIHILLQLIISLQKKKHHCILSRVSTLTRDIDIANLCVGLSVYLSVAV